MSTQEEKKIVDEELNVAPEEVTMDAATAEETKEATEEAQEEPLSEVDALKKQLAEAMEKNEELQDRYLRQAAEFDN